MHKCVLYLSPFVAFVTSIYLLEFQFTYSRIFLRAELGIFVSFKVDPSFFPLTLCCAHITCPDVGLLLFSI